MEPIEIDSPHSGENNASSTRQARSSSILGKRDRDFPGRRVRDAFFVAKEGVADTWELKQETNSVDSRKSSTQTPATMFYARKKTVHAHGWIDLVVNGLQPFSIVENEVFRRHVRYEHLSTKTLVRYLSKLSTRVEDRIRNLLPEKFALIFDGWTSSDTHFVAIFASFPVKSTNGYRTVLLSFSPFEDEVSQNAKNHYLFACFVLDLYGKSFNNVVALIGDNCETNKLFATLAGTYFVGCASHRFNLAVHDLASDSQHIINKVQSLMRKLKHPIPAAKLRKFTHLRAKLSNVTRWSSTVNMLKRYCEIREDIDRIDIEGIDEFIPDRRERKTIDDLCVKFECLDSVTKKLQADSTTMADVRALFDGVIKSFPDTHQRLSATARIIRDHSFESGVCKLQVRRYGDRNLDEVEATSCLRVEEVESISGSSGRNASIGLSFAEKCLQDAIGDSNPENFLDVRFIVPTSNICERLFSTAGNTLRDRRKSISPMNLEIQLFLHINSDLWGISDVNTVVK
eukprot:IDg21824t1